MSQRRISFKVSNEIVFDQLPDDLRERIASTLTISNPERQNAQNQKIPGWWRIPEHIKLYTQQAGLMTVPRGVFSDLMGLFSHMGLLDVSCKDSTISFPAAIPEFRVDLRTHQTLAVDKITEGKTGIYEAPPGSGKTVTTLFAMARTQQRSIVIVNTTNIASQWADRCETFLGFRPGVIGDGSWDESQPITIALNQTLASRSDELQESGWFDQWGFVCLDECHHVTASTFFAVMSRFSARWRIGVSATPDRDNGLAGVAYAVLGPVLHRTEKSELKGQGFLVEPSIKKVPTTFNHPYFSTHWADSTCELEGCIEVGRHRHQNNYQAVVGALAEDTHRNDLIAARISSNWGCANLVLSKRLGHLERLRALVLEGGKFDESRLFMLTGRESTEERMRVVAEADAASCVIFSTIADEALDVPRLDRLYLTWPTKSSAVIRQQVGRVERAHPRKTTAVVYDFVDGAVAPLARQWSKRSIDVYAREGFLIST